MSTALTPQLYVDGAWVTYPGYAEDGWSMSMGPDVESGVRPSSISVTLNNDDLSMDPSNVRSSLYGKIGRNTRARLLINGLNLTLVEASSWQPDATVEHVPGVRGKSWTDLQGEGLLRRLGRWTDPIRSAMARQIVSYPSLTGYWTLEDGSDSTQLSNEVAGGLPGSFSGTVTLSGDDGPGGADGAVKMGSDGSLRGTFKTPSGNGYQVSWTAKLANNPTSGTYLNMFTWVDAQRRTWEWSVNNTAHQILVTAADGTVLSTGGFTYGTRVPNQWVRYRVKVTVSGSTLTYEPAIYLQDASGPAGGTSTFSATTAGRPTSWKILGNAWTDGAAFGQVLAMTDTSYSLITGEAADSFDGYLGETTTNRYARLMREEGFTPYGVGPVGTTPMGRQKPGVFLDLITEATITEAGLLYDEPGNIGLAMVTYRGQINKTPVLTLTKSQIQAPLRKTIDDVGIINDITVRNWDGSTARSTLDSGALSTDIPPAGIGRVKASVDVSMALNSRLASRANWEMRKGTLDRPRYLSVSVNLLANPSLVNTIASIRPGNWITITGVEPDTITLRIISLERRGDAVNDVVTFNCLPAEVYQVGIYNDAGSRYDSGSTTLAAAITTTTQTSISLTTASYNDRWSTTAVPYDIKIAGERMTVTAMTAGSGTGPVTQTATVTRAVNGVAKTHAVTAPDGSATQVHLFNIVRYGLS
jgi:hypothetical protein